LKTGTFSSWKPYWYSVDSSGFATIGVCPSSSQ